MYYVVMLKNPHAVIMAFAMREEEIPYDYWSILYREGSAVASFSECVEILTHVRERGYLPRQYEWRSRLGSQWKRGER